MNYYRRFMGDYANHTRHLTFAEHGAYCLMLDWCYANERPLPKKKEEIYRQVCARTEGDMAAIDYVLSQFFRRTKRGHVQKRVLEEIQRIKDKSKVNSVNGRKGGISRQANARNSLSERQANFKPFQTLDSRLQRPEPKPDPTVPLVDVSSSNKSIASSLASRVRTEDTFLPTPKPKPVKRDRFGMRLLKQGEDHKSKKEAADSAAVISAMALPDWIPITTWMAFRELRQKKRSPLTAHGVDLIIAKLIDLQAKGHDPVLVLEQSIMNGWTGLFELKGGNGNGLTKAQEKSRRNAAAILNSSSAGGLSRTVVNGSGGNISGRINATLVDGLSHHTRKP